MKNLHILYKKKDFNIKKHQKRQLEQESIKRINSIIDYNKIKFLCKKNKIILNNTILKNLRIFHPKILYKIYNNINI